MNAIAKRIRLRRICRAVGIRRLRPWQRAALLREEVPDLASWHRASGKTLTAVLHVLMYRRRPLKLSRTSMNPMIPDLDGMVNARVGLHTTEELIRLHTLCRNAGIPVCDLDIRDDFFCRRRGYVRGGF